jgi:hypothetical protein
MIKKLKCELRNGRLSFQPQLEIVRALSLSRVRIFQRGRLIMCIDLRRCTLAALLSLSLVGCAAARETQPTPQTGEMSRAHPACDLAAFSSAASRCDVSDPARPAYLVVQTTSERVTEECAKLVDFAAPQGELGARWTLEITSLDAGGASCTLRLPILSDIPTPLWSIIEEVLLLAVDSYPREADELLGLMISMLEQIRVRLAQTASE